MSREIDIRAVVFGSMVDLLGTTFFSMLFYSLVAVRLKSRGIESEKIQEHMIQWSSDPEGFLYTLFFGLSFTFFGGYIAARVSRSETLINSAIVGGISIITSVVFLEHKEPQTWLLPTLLTIPVSIAGGYHYLKRWTFNKRDDDHSEDEQNLN